MRRKRGKMREKCVEKGENHSDPIYTNPIKNLPTYHRPTKVVGSLLLRLGFKHGCELCAVDPTISKKAASQYSWAKGSRPLVFAARATVYKTLRALQAQNRTKVSKRVFCKKVPTKVTRKHPKLDFLGSFFDIFGYFWRLFCRTPPPPKKALFDTSFLRFWARSARRLL